MDPAAPDRLAAALRAAEARFQALAEAAPDAILVLDRGVIRYVNPAGARLLASAVPVELVGHSVAEFLPEEQVRIMGERLGRVAAGEQLDPLEYSSPRPDGSLNHVEISSTAIEWDGRPAVLAIGRDIGERRRMQEELIRADRMAAVGALAAGVSHEIANPLTYVLLQLQRLRDALPRLVTDDTQRAAVGRMIEDAYDGGERMRGILRDLLEFARSEAADSRLVDVRTVLEATLRLAAASLRDPIRVVREYGEVPPVMASARRLEQVFLNLVINACQAFGDCPPADACIRVRTERTGDGVLIAIADNGPGIPAADRGRVFEPFFTTKPSGVGTGLGLSISRAIVETIGGRLEVGESTGGGVTARVYLPAAAADADADAPAAVVPRPRVLVIDDEPLVLRALGAVLGDDYMVTLVPEVDQALSTLLGPLEFSVVVCDVNMPGLNGFELYDRVCAARPRYRSRFLFVTGGAIGALSDQQSAAHRHRIISKPCDPVQLLEAAQRIRRG